MRQAWRKAAAPANPLAKPPRRFAQIRLPPTLRERLRRHKFFKS